MEPLRDRCTMNVLAMPYFLKLGERARAGRARSRRGSRVHGQDHPPRTVPVRRPARCIGPMPASAGLGGWQAADELSRRLENWRMTSVAVVLSQGVLVVLDEVDILRQVSDTCRALIAALSPGQTSARRRFTPTEKRVRSLPWRDQRVAPLSSTAMAARKASHLGS
jgi:hypothetical protein